MFSDETISAKPFTFLFTPWTEELNSDCLPTVLARKFNIGFLYFRVEQRSPTIYVGGGQDFLSEIGLFRRLPGTDLFASRVKSGSTIELGENVQLRSIVRGGDGKMSNFDYNLVHSTATLFLCFVI